MFEWWREADQPARRAFIAASLGWMLDSFDVMLYALVLAELLRDPVLQLTAPVAGQLGSITLLAAAAGGVTFGVIADRIGRKRALMAAVLIYSVFTAACGLAQNVAQLAVFRVLLGFGMGGALLQKVHRDTQKFAFKCSCATVNGEDRDVFKDPITDHGKKSKKGRLKLVYKNGKYQTKALHEAGEDILQTVFENGVILREIDFLGVKGNGLL